jgi:hypothetical protein
MITPALTENIASTLYAAAQLQLRMPVQLKGNGFAHREKIRLAAHQQFLVKHWDHLLEKRIPQGIGMRKRFVNFCEFFVNFQGLKRGKFCIY